MLGAISNAQNAASTVVNISSVTGLEAELANKQPLLSSNASVELANLTCSLLKAGGEQSLRLSDQTALSC